MWVTAEAWKPIDEHKGLKASFIVPVFLFLTCSSRLALDDSFTPYKFCNKDAGFLSPEYQLVSSLLSRRPLRRILSGKRITLGLPLGPIQLPFFFCLVFEFYFRFMFCKR